MKRHISLSWSGTRRTITTFLLLVITFCAKAMPSQQDSAGFFFITGHRSDGFTATVSDSTLSPDWFPCARSFMFPTYVGDSLRFFPSYLVPPDDPAIWYAIVYDENHTQIGPMYYFWDYQGFPDTAVSIPGLYQINFLTVRGLSIDTVVKTTLLIIPKIQRVWAEADPICSDWTPAEQQNDGKFHFKIKTYPDVDSIMRFINKYRNGGTAPSCNQIESEELDMYANAGVSMDPVAGSNEAFIYRTYNNPQPFGQYPDLLNYYGSTWDSTHYPYPNDYYMFYAYDSINPGYYTLHDFLSGGSLYGDSLFINAHIYDGIDPDGWTVSAPLLIDGQYNLNSYTVTGNEVWEPGNNPAGGSTLRIRDSLLIAPGASLTIHGMRVEFGPDAICYVTKGSPSLGKAGAYLELDSTTFDWYHSCNIETPSALWQGVVVTGNSNLPQSSGYQGKMVTKWSTISHAEIGVSLFDAMQWNIYHSGTGGILRANATTFSNNGMAVLFFPYHNINPVTHGEEYNQSIFNDCDFTLSESIPTAFNYFIKGTTIRGVGVHGCRFSNTTGSGGGYGIYGTDMNFWIDNLVAFPNIPVTKQSKFSGLSMGVYLKNVSGTSSMTLRKTLFDENIQGAMLDAVQIPEVTTDTFKIHAYPLTWPDIYLALISSGYTQNTGSGYIVHNNRFERSNAFNTGYGTAAIFSGTGSSPNLVSNNTYVDMNVGNLSNYLNRGVNINNSPTGLQFKCNTHSNNYWGEYAGGTDSNSHGIRSLQGELNLPAANSFSGGSTDVGNPGNQVKQITYYYHGTSPTSQGNVTKTSVSQTNTCTITNTDHTGNGYFGLTIRTLNTSNHLTAPHLSDSTLNDQSSDSTLLSRDQVYQNINYFLNDSTGSTHRDSLYFWVAQAQTAYTDLLYADLMIADSTDSAGCLLALHYVYDSITHWYNLDSTERNEFKQGRKLEQLKISVKLSGREIDSLTKDETDILQEVADSSSMWAKVRAQSWMSLISGDEYNYDVILPVDSTDTLGGARPININNLIGNTANIQQDKNNVYPNPVHDFLYVNYINESGKEAFITISDVTGKVLVKKRLLSSSLSSTINLKGLVSGIYFYRISEGGTIKVQGKIAKD